MGTGSRAASPRPAMLPRGRSWPPVRPRLPAWLLYRIQRLLAPNAFYRRLAGWLERSPARYRAFTAAEKAVKSGVFGCRMCGQCALPATAYACPMTCPKQLRNGPCGGVGSDGGCEVYPELRCVWLVAYERAEADGRVADLRLLQRPSTTGAGGRARGSTTGRGGTRTSGPTRDAAARYRPCWRRRTPCRSRDRPPRCAQPAWHVAPRRIRVTAEIGPPRGADPDAVRRKARRCATGWTRPTSPMARARSRGCPTGRAASLAMPEGVEPVMQVSAATATGSRCRPTCSPPSAVGIPNVLLHDGRPSAVRRPSRRQGRVRPGRVQLRVDRPHDARRATAAVRAHAGPAAALADRGGREPVRPAGRLPRGHGWARRSPPARSSPRRSSSSTSPRSRAGCSRSATSGWTGAARSSPGSGRSGRCGRWSYMRGNVPGMCDPGRDRPTAARRPGGAGWPTKGWRCAPRSSSRSSRYPASAASTSWPWAWDDVIPEVLARAGLARPVRARERRALMHIEHAPGRRTLRGPERAWMPPAALGPVLQPR